MSVPDRAAVLAEQESWAAGKAYRPEPAEDARTHQQEIRASHQGRPTIAEQNATHGVPAPDKGMP